MGNVLVTGGAGFLGSHLCKRLIENGENVFCIDNLISGDYANIEELTKKPSFKFIKHDITEPIELEVDKIFNLACPASPIQYQERPIETMKSCFIGALNMLELAKKNKAVILQTSTSEVYGDPKIYPQDETYWGNVNPIGFRSCYDEGKRAAEALFFCYKRVHKLDIRVVRIFNTYGPKMAENDGRVISNFINQALKGKNLTIYGDGSQTRSFCYVEDMITALLSVMDCDESEDISPLNLGNPYEITIKELAERIISLTGSTSEIEYCELPKDDPVRRCPDIKKAKKYLTWEPKISLKEGLEKTIDYFRCITKNDEAV